MLSTEYSLWFLPLCVLLGVAYASILYVKADKPELPLWVKRLSFATRTLAIALIAFLLLNPLVKRIAKEVEKPLILLGIDNSSSLTIGNKATFYQGKFKENLQNLINQLEENYEVESYLVGDSLRTGKNPDYKDEKTNISSFFEQIQTVYANRNVGAVVLLSDGIYNTGNNPYYIANQTKAPIYTVSMGDTSIYRDALISRVNYNKTAYRNNFFPIEILVKANKLSGQLSRLSIYYENDIVFEKEIRINSNNFSEWIRVNFEAKKSGLHRYKIVLSDLEGEITKENNVKDVFIEVIDQRKKVGIIYNAPHPDVAAISRSLENSEVYQVESFSADKFNGKVGEYDMMVLHQLPSSKNPANHIISAINQAGIPCLYILGQQVNYAQFNQLNTGVQVLVNKDMSNDAFATYNQNYANFTVTAPLQQAFSSFPPVKVPFGNFKISASASILLYQKIGAVSTNYPLFVFNQDTENKKAVFLGDGLWRWRMHNFMLENHHEEFDELISKTFQFLSTKADKSFFRVMGKNVYSENENIHFDAELYNQNYELVNDPEVQMTITDSDKKTYSFAFSRNFKSYRLDAGTFPEGDYRWEATTIYNNEKYSKTGHFSVEKVNLETINLTADFQLMANLASLNNGQNFPEDKLLNIADAIKNNSEIKSIAHYNKQHTSLLDNIWLLIVIIVLLSTEWVLRKWSGAY